MPDTKESLEKAIKLSKYRLKQFSKEILETESGNIAYNRLLIEKATLVDKLQKENTNKFINFIKKTYRKATNKKLICDSF